MIMLMRYISEKTKWWKTWTHKEYEMKATITYTGKGFLSDSTLETISFRLGDHPYFIELKPKFEVDRIPAWYNKQRIVQALKTDDNFLELFMGRMFPKNPLGNEDLKMNDKNYTLNGMIVCFKNEIAYDAFVKEFSDDIIENTINVTYSYEIAKNK